MESSKEASRPETEVPAEIKFGRRAGDRSAVSRCKACSARDACGFVDVAEFQAIVEPRVYGRNATIIRQGEPANHVFLIRSGLIQLIHTAPNGKSVIDLIRPGWALGAPWAITRKNYAYTALTLEETETERVEVAKFLAYLHSHPQAAVLLLKDVSGQLMRVLDNLYGIAGKVPSERRLKQALLEIAEMAGLTGNGSGSIRIPISIQMLADRIGCSRQWVSKILKELEARGEIQRRGSWITLKSEDFCRASAKLS